MTKLLSFIQRLHCICKYHWWHILFWRCTLNLFSSAVIKLLGDPHGCNPGLRLNSIWNSGLAYAVALSTPICSVLFYLKHSTTKFGCMWSALDTCFVTDYNGMGSREVVTLTGPRTGTSSALMCEHVQSFSLEHY